MKRVMSVVVLGAALSACGYVQVVSKPVDRGPVVPEISSTLLTLLDAQERGVVSASDYRSTSLGVISSLGTPAGLRLRLRYQELGISLVEALKLSRDKDLFGRLIELARWSQGRRVKSEALITIASFSSPDNLGDFQTALKDLDVGIRFAAVEAVERWNQEGSRAILQEAMRDPWSPLLRVFAARAALSQGDESGLPVLFSALEDRSWIVRALAGRYLGDHVKPDDYVILQRALDRETRNDFVMAELAIATLKLLARRDPKGAAALAPRRTQDAGVDGYRVAPDAAIEMDPLVLRPPRLYLRDDVRLAQSINEKLLRLIRDRLDQPSDPELESDPNYQDMNRLVTPEGFALQTRYSELSVAVAEGLAGTTDQLLRTELRRIAQTNRNAVARATALLSLAYTRSQEDLPLINAALSDSDPIVRFGAMEAAQAGRFKELTTSLLSIASADAVPAFRVFALQALIVLGEPSGYNQLVVAASNPDWPARAMAYWYLGRYGKESDHSSVRNALSSEKNPFVLAEAVLATQRLAPN